MRKKISCCEGFTLLEVLLAAIIFIVSVAGIFATLSAVRAPVTSKENALVSAVFGKKILETLRTNVSSATGGTLFYGICTAGCNCTTVLNLCLGAHTVTLPAGGFSWPTADLTTNNPTLNYTVKCADGSVDAACGANVARKVQMDINW